MNRLVTAATIGLLVLVATSLVLAPTGAHVGSDVGYYLPLAKLIGEGRWPMRDVPVHYTPLGIFFLALPTFFGSAPQYPAFVAVQELALLVGAVLTFATLRRLGAQRTASLWAASYFVFCGLYFEGSTMLEPFVAMFAALGLAIAKGVWPLPAWLRWPLVGLAGGLAVLCKQQGVFLVAALAVIVTFQRTGSWRWRATGFGVGGLIALLFLFLLVLTAHGGPWVALANLTWSGRQYSGQQLLAGAGLVGSLFLLKTSPFLVGVPFIDRSRDEWGALLVATALGVLPAALKPYPHYLVLALPTSALLGGLVMQWLASGGRRSQVIALALCVGLGLQLVRLVRRLRGPEQNLAQMQQDGAALAALIGARHVLQLTRPSLTYFGNITPARVDIAGFMFGGYFKLEELRTTLLPDAQVVLTEPDATSFAFNDGAWSFDELTAAGFCSRAERIGGAMVWERCR